jgi:hypothetical protein
MRVTANLIEHRFQAPQSRPARQRRKAGGLGRYPAGLAMTYLSGASPHSAIMIGSLEAPKKSALIAGAVANIAPIVNTAYPILPMKASAAAESENF